jgi:hypothetical protein
MKVPEPELAFALQKTCFEHQVLRADKPEMHSADPYLPHRINMEKAKEKRSGELWVTLVVPRLKVRAPKLRKSNPPPSRTPHLTFIRSYTICSYSERTKGS